MVQKRFGSNSVWVWNKNGTEMMYSFKILTKPIFVRKYTFSVISDNFAKWTISDNFSTIIYA